MNEGCDFAVVGGGCFWCIEAMYQRLLGVVSVESGYAGGHDKQPTYTKICTGDTGHAEVVKVVFDTKIISYAEIIELFWKIHDPTTLNQQGADKGTQYRSIILARNKKQKKLARESIVASQKNFPAMIVTQIEQLDLFWPAESEHQNFFNRNKYQPYCIFNIFPKLKKLGL